MAILSASLIIQSLSTTHLIIAYFLLTSPATIADLNLVFILGAAMDLVCTSSPLSPPLLFLRSSSSFFFISRKKGKKRKSPYREFLYVKGKKANPRRPPLALFPPPS